MLASTLFNILTNHLPNVISRWFMFADISLAAKDRDSQKIEENLNNDMAAIAIL